MAVRILVTGGAGYIGSHMVRLPICQGHRVKELSAIVEIAWSWFSRQPAKICG